LSKLEGRDCRILGLDDEARADLAGVRRRKRRTLVSSCSSSSLDESARAEFLPIFLLACAISSSSSSFPGITVPSSRIVSYAQPLILFFSASFAATFLGVALQVCDGVGG
jgi:hypothetical protein